MNYAIYDTNNQVITLYEGDIPPLLTPNILISDADFNMAKTNSTNFKVQNNVLIPIENCLYYLGIKKDFLIMESDSYTFVDYQIPKGYSIVKWQAMVSTYRQALRDFIGTCDINSPVFPLFSTDPIVPTFIELQEQKWDDIKRSRDLEERTPLPYMNKLIDFDVTSSARLTWAIQTAITAKFMSQTFNVDWTTADGSVLTLTENDILGIPVAVATRSNVIHQKARTLADQITIATTQEQLDAIVW